MEIDIHVETRGALKEWHGSFSLDRSSVFSQDEYELKLADGRSGCILITGTSLSSGSNMMVVRFTGTGPLQRSARDQEYAN
jgi:hypothetical protein